MSKQTLLMISIELPYPANSGGRVKSWNMLKYLTNHYSVALACPLKYGSEHVTEFSQLVDLDKLLYEKVEEPRSPKNLIKSYLKAIPLNVLRSGSKKLKERIAEIANDYEVMLIDHYEAAQYIPDHFRGKVIFHAHNATYLMWDRYGKEGNNWVMRTIANCEAKRVAKFESEICRRSDLFFASPNDIDNLSKIGADTSLARETYHLGDDTQLALPSIRFEETEKRLLYVGTLSWEANVDGLLWFIEQVWPEIKANNPNLILDIAGGNPAQRLVDRVAQIQDIHLLGFVDDLEPLFKRSRVFVAPLTFGSGIKVKVLNSMCRGLPISTTSVGAEGIDADHLTHLCIDDTAADMANSIDRLLHDQRLWETLEQKSRERVREKYTWDRVLGFMVNEINLLSA